VFKHRFMGWVLSITAFLCHRLSFESSVHETSRRVRRLSSPLTENYAVQGPPFFVCGGGGGVPGCRRLVKGTGWLPVAWHVLGARRGGAMR
jgi:hypothetical protein